MTLNKQCCYLEQKAKQMHFQLHSQTFGTISCVGLLKRKQERNYLKPTNYLNLTNLKTLFTPHIALFASKGPTA